MKLPNGDLAIVEIGKLQDYCLNWDHPTGRNKARVFAAVGITRSDASILRTAILEAAATSDATLGSRDGFGQRYVIDFNLVRNERVVTIRTSWMIRLGDDLPRLTTCYVL